MVRLSATDVARNFSEVLNRVDAGEEIEIVRNGASIAELKPPARPRGMSGSALRMLLEGLPSVEEQFEDDVERARGEIWPAVEKWPPT